VALIAGCNDATVRRWSKAQAVYLLGTRATSAALRVDAADSYHRGSNRLAQNVWEYQNAPSSNSPQPSPPANPPQSGEGSSSNGSPSSRGPDFPNPQHGPAYPKTLPLQQPARHRLKLGMHRYERSQLNRVMDLVADSALRPTDELGHWKMPMRLLWLALIFAVLGPLGAIAQASSSNRGAAFPSPGSQRGANFPEGVSPTQTNPTNWVTSPREYTEPYPWRQWWRRYPQRHWRYGYWRYR
jgi:hypothetical protein